MSQNDLIPIEVITSKIFIIRKQKVMLDRDLATLYSVETRRLNEQVRRNIDRFPEDFMFQLTKSEFEILISQIATSSWGGIRKLPFAFTENGVAMLSSVLSSPQAVQINISIMRVFTKIRNMYAVNADLRTKIKELEGRQNKTEDDIQMLISAVNMLLDPPPEEPKTKIGFTADRD